MLWTRWLQDRRRQLRQDLAHPTDSSQAHPPFCARWRSCAYRVPEQRQLNQSVFEKLYVYEDQEIVSVVAEPYRSLLGGSVHDSSEPGKSAPGMTNPPPLRSVNNRWSAPPWLTRGQPRLWLGRTAHHQPATSPAASPAAEGRFLHPRPLARLQDGVVPVTGPAVSLHPRRVPTPMTQPQRRLDPSTIRAMDRARAAGQRSRHSRPSSGSTAPRSFHASGTQGSGNITSRPSGPPRFVPPDRHRGDGPTATQIADKVAEWLAALREGPAIEMPVTVADGLAAARRDGDV